VQWTFRRLPQVYSASPFIVLPPGLYEVDATATDTHGNVSTATIHIYVVGVPSNLEQTESSLLSTLQKSL
jgi:hypothetical protein